MSSKKVVMPYFLAGSAHLVVARAVGHYIVQKRPDWEIRYIEPSDELKDIGVRKFYRDSWTKLLKSPFLAKLVFVVGEVFYPLARVYNAYVIRRIVPKAFGFFVGYQPDALFSTHWGCTHIFSKARKLGYDVPIFYIDTDMAAAYYLQNCGADVYFVLSEDAAYQLSKKGVPPEKIVRVNFLVRPQFMELPPKKEARKILDLDLSGDEFLILFTAGGEGIGPVEEFVRAFLEASEESSGEKAGSARMIVVTGRNRTLYEKLRENYPAEKVVPLGYREDMHILMAASDVVSGKCGANYTMETIVSGRPFIITQIGAPNEKPNMEFVVKNGYGWYAPDPEKFKKILRRIFDDESFLKNAYGKLSEVPRKNGAEEIANYIISYLEVS